MGAIVGLSIHRTATLGEGPTGEASNREIVQNLINTIGYSLVVRYKYCFHFLLF